MKKAGTIAIALFLFSAIAMLNAQGVGPVYGLEYNPLLGASSNYGWELAGIYPYIGLKAGPLRLTAFGGGGISTSILAEEPHWTWTYGFGGNLDVVFYNYWLIGAGGGMAGPNFGNADKKLYPFIRGSVGFSSNNFIYKLFYDRNFDNNGWEAGFLVSYDLNRPSYTPPAPKPPYTPPAPRSQPVIPQVKIVNNTGYTGFYLFVVPASQDDLGDDVLGENILLEGYSINVRLAYQLNAVNKYTIVMVDEDDDMYVKRNILLSSNNQTVAFTLDDLYVPPREDHPTITPEDLNRVELAYAETVRFIQQRGKRLYIRNMSERNAFIRQYQGKPETGAVRAARDKKLEWYDIRTTSQEDIVALAKKEPNAFVKVRMIHDWVSDVFFYDRDLLQWIENVSGRNAEFTLGKIIERQRGVCFEYAVLFWFLLDAVGIDNYLISDHSEPEIGHAYNMVLINSTGYIIDTTWDSGNKYESGKIINFRKMISKDYFMPDISHSYQLRGW